MVDTQTKLTISNYVLSGFVGFHIFCEFVHYIMEFIKNRRDKNMLEHLDDHLDRIEIYSKCKEDINE